MRPTMSKMDTAPHDPPLVDAEPEAGGPSSRRGASVPTWLRDWTVIVPIIGAATVAIGWGMQLGPILVVVAGVLLGASVLAAVHHAEVIAHRVGEPFGSLVLAVAVTLIEVALIVTLMVSSSGTETASLARDTVFAAVMITCNGILGLSVLIAALRGGMATFNAAGMATALATVTTIATLSLVLPTVTTSAGDGQFAPPQLAFAAVMSLVLYGVFVLIQTVRHRDMFVPGADERGRPEDEAHAESPTATAALASLGMLLIALVAVVGLAKIESPAIETAIAAIGAPASAVGVVIALLVLLPETLAAARNAQRGRVQTSLNLAFGSAIASIGLTVPTIAVVSIWLPGPLVLGLEPTQIVLLTVTVAVASLTVLPGRATLQEGAIHLVLLGAFLVLAVVP